MMHATTSQGLAATTSPHGLTFLIEGMAKDCSPAQQIREFIQNEIDAILKTENKTGEISIDVDPFYLEEENLRKLCIVGNGIGMDEHELIYHIQSIATSSSLQSFHDNFGLGARIAGSIENPQGVIYMSWKNGIGHMVQFWKNPETQVYELKALAEDNPTPWIVRLPDEYKPACINQHGTKVVLLGRDENDDTTEAKEIPLGVERKKWIPFYINNRYFKFPEGITIRCFPSQDTWKTRVIKGMHHHLTNNSCDSDKIMINDVLIHWWILNTDQTGKKNARGDACIENSHVAVLYKNELYNLKTGSAGRSILSSFGIVHGAKRVVIYAEPKGLDYMPDLTRSTIKIKGNDLPWDDWGLYFKANMPTALIKLESESASALAPTNTDDIKRLLSSVMEYFQYSASNKKKDISDSETENLVCSPDIDGTVSDENVNDESENKESGSAGGSGGSGGGSSGGSGSGSSSGSGSGKSGGKRGGKKLKENNLYNRLRTKSKDDDSVPTIDKRDDLPTVRWGDDSHYDFRGLAAIYYHLTNEIVCNQSFSAFVNLHAQLVADKKLTGIMIQYCRDSIRKWYAVSLTDAVMGVRLLSRQLNWPPETRRSALSSEALTTICVQKLSQVSNIKRELGSKGL